MGPELKSDDSTTPAATVQKSWFLYLLIRCGVTLQLATLWNITHCSKLMHALLPASWLLIVFTVGLLAFGAGAAGWASWSRHQENLRRRAPTHWPITLRVIINSEERRVWRWLELAFVEYSVMVKMPMTRFFSPNSHKQGVYWYQLLSSLYCSFTVVRADGQVMGCVDLPSQAGEKSKSRRMKASILAQCGIPYVVLKEGAQPSLAQIRAKFLGGASSMPQSAQQAAAMHAASSNLRNSISRNRQTRHVPQSQSSHQDRASAPDSEFNSIPSSGFSAFGQEDSFIAPLDSRKAPLSA